MKRRVIFFVFLLLICSGSVALFFYWRSDHRQIVLLIDQMIELAGKEQSDIPHEGVLKFVGSENIFADPVEIYSEYPRFSRALNKDECRTMLAFLHRNVSFLTVKKDNLHLDISGENAGFVFDAEVYAGFRNGSRTREVLFVRGRAAKISGKWRIAELTAEQLLKR